MKASEVVDYLKREIKSEIAKIHSGIRSEKRVGTDIEIGILGGYSTALSLLDNINDRIDDEKGATKCPQNQKQPTS